MTLIGPQYFGDGIEDTYDLPGTVPAGSTLGIKVAGKFADFEYDDADTIVLAVVPDAGAIISFYAVDEIIMAEQVITPTINSKDGDLVYSAVNNGAGTTMTTTKSSTGTLTMANADADNNRNVLIIVDVTEAFVTGTGTQPTFKIGETSTTDKFAATSAFTSAALGVRKVYSGTLLATKALLVTAVAAVGDATGAIKVTAIILPTAA